MMLEQMDHSLYADSRELRDALGILTTTLLIPRHRLSH